MLAAILIILAVACVAAIFYLASQGVRETGDVALAAERWLLAHVRPTGTGSIGEPTWWGLTIRMIAHVVEYAAFGVVAAAAAAVLLHQAGLVSWAASAGICLALSVADEVHKRFVPGRHFDAKDLRLDALGYLPATILTTLVCLLIIR